MLPSLLAAASSSFKDPAVAKSEDKAVLILVFTYLRLQQPNFSFKCCKIIKLSVNRSEPYVSDFVYVSEFGHDPLTNLLAANFISIAYSLFDAVNSLVNGFKRNMPFFASFDEAGSYLFADVRLAAAVLLDNHEADISPFICGKSLSARLALAPTSCIVFAVTLVNNFCLTRTERTSDQDSSP